MIFERVHARIPLELQTAGISIIRKMKREGNLPRIGFLFFNIKDINEISSTISKITEEHQFPIVGASYGTCAFSDVGITDTGFVLGILGGEENEINIDVRYIENEAEKQEEIRNSIHEMSRNTSRVMYRKGTKHFSLIILHTAFSLDGDTLADLIGKSGIIGKVAGGMAGDMFKFQKTYITLNEKITDKGLLLVGIYTSFPTGVGVQHGWEALSSELLATKVEGNKLIEINGKPALDVYIDELSKNGVNIKGKTVQEILETIAGFYEIGIYSIIQKKFIIRAPLNIEGKSIILAGKIPQNSRIYIMKTSKESLQKASEESVNMAIKDRKSGDKPNFGIFFSCAARHLNFGEEYYREIEAIKKSMQGQKFIGFATYGEYSKGFGGFSRFNNTTLVSFVG
jgi:hypothetical protein